MFYEIPSDRAASFSVRLYIYSVELRIKKHLTCSNMLSVI